MKLSSRYDGTQVEQPGRRLTPSIVGLSGLATARVAVWSHHCCMLLFSDCVATVNPDDLGYFKQTRSTHGVE